MWNCNFRAGECAPVFIQFGQRGLDAWKAPQIFEAKRGWMSTSFLSHFLIEGPCKFIGPWPSVKQPMYMNRH